MAPRTSSWPIWSNIVSTDNNIKSADDWIKARQKEEGADELWRVHDGLYDLEKWIYSHPGGSQWLEITKVRTYFLYTLFYNVKYVFCTRRNNTYNEMHSRLS